MSKQRLATLEKEMAELRDSFNSKKAQWENEKNAVNKVQSLRAEVESTKAEIEKATRTGDYAKPVSCNTASCPPCKSSWRKKKSWPKQRKNPACFVTA